MHRIFLFLPFLLLCCLFSAGCFQDGPWDNCPDFEVRRLTFREEAKLPRNRSISSSFLLMRWNILGPVRPLSPDLEKPDMEEEKILCGFVNAPYPAMWRVKHFPLEQEKDPRLEKEADFTLFYKDVKKDSLFYFCATLENPEWEKEALLHINSSNLLLVYWNGEKVFSSGNTPMNGEEKSVKVKMLKGNNRLTLKYRDGKDLVEKRAISFRLTLPDEGKCAMIR